MRIAYWFNRLQGSTRDLPTGTSRARTRRSPMAQAQKIINAGQGWTTASDSDKSIGSFEGLRVNWISNANGCRTHRLRDRAYAAADERLLNVHNVAPTEVFFSSSALGGSKQCHSQHIICRFVYNLLFEADKPTT